MRIMKRWLALMLTALIVISDRGSMAVFAAEGVITAAALVSENDEGSRQADEAVSEDGYERLQAGEAETGGRVDMETSPESDDENQGHEELLSVQEEAAASETDTEAELPALHIGQIKEGEPFPGPEDSAFVYDLPVSFEMSDSVVLFVNYRTDVIPEKEEKGTLVWSILCGNHGMEEGSASLIREEDDWTGFETVSDSPYFTMTEEEENGYYKTVRLTAKVSAYHEDCSYYIRAAYYLGTGEGKEEEFYTAATIPFLPCEAADQADSDETQDDAADAEVGVGQTEQPQDDAADAQTGAGQTEQPQDDAADAQVGANQTEQPQDDGADAEADAGQTEQPQDDAIEAEAADTDQTQEESGIEDFAADQTQAEEEPAVPVNADTQQSPEEVISDITLDKSNITLHPGETEQVNATVVPAEAADRIVWTSSDKSVATVDANGMITARAEGKAQITAMCGDATAAAGVEVVRADDDKMLDLSGEIWVAGFKRESEDFVYTGQKITQDIRVYYRDTLLKEKTDYTLSYKNNINAASYHEVKAPSVTINLKGQYSGSVTLYYTIKPADIKAADLYGTIQDNAGGEHSSGYVQAVNYSKTLKIPNPDLMFGKTRLKANKDFVCDYVTVPEDDENYVPLPEDYKNGDSYEYGKAYDYIVNGTGNFTGTLRMQLVVVKDKNLNLGSAVVKLGRKQYEYHGTALSKAEVDIESVKVNGRELDGSLYDYEVCAGKIQGAYVLVYPSETGSEAGYCGYKKVNLKLVGDRNMKDAALGERWQDSIIFSQKTVNEEGGIFQEKTGVLIFGTEEGKETLTEGEDYTVKYSNARKAGKVTVTFTGTGRYKGSLRKQYEITPNGSQQNLKLIWKNVTYEDGTPVVAYQKGGAAPEFVLKDQNNNILKNKIDYTVKLTNNKVPGETMSCAVSGKGNYKGYSKTVELKVSNGDISRAKISVPDKPYSTKKNAWKSKVTIKDVNGKTLAAGTDYDKEVLYAYEGMESGQPPKAGTVVQVTVLGTGCYEGTVITGEYRIYEKSISKLKITIDPQEYTGEEIKLSKGDIHVYATTADMKKKNELGETCFEITGYKNNIKAGTGKVTLRGAGNYGGTRTCSFKIQKKKYLINHVKRITLDNTELSVRLADKKAQLTATIIPEDTRETVSNPTIIWATSNSSIAAVETDTAGGAHATVIFKKEGTVTITAAAQDGNKKAQCKITIVDAPILEEAGQTIEGEVGGTYQLTVKWDESQVADPNKLKWESNNTDRVTVDKNGLVTMKKTGAAVITLRVGKSNYVQQCNVVVKGEEILPEGRALIYEQKPGTVDDTKAINKLLQEWEWNPDTYDYMYIPAGVYRIDAVTGLGGIVLVSNQKLIMSPGALLIAMANGSKNYQVIYAFGRDNITISGGQIIGERKEHKGTSGEWGHGINIEGCTNVHISDVDISQCWGDGIYLGAYDGWDSNGNAKRYDSDKITIENCNLHHNRRNNLSITDASNVTIDHCRFNNAKGTDPQYGIDIEPNYRGTCKHVTISNSTFKGNAKASMGIITPASDIRLENCTLDGAFYNMAGKNVVLKNTTIKGEIVDSTGGIRRE